MVKILRIATLLLWFMAGFHMTNLSGQVEFKLELLPDSVTYRVTMKPSATWNPPMNITSSAQVTIKAPTGGFVVSNTTPIVAGTSWSHNATYVSPSEEPGYDYFSFGLTSLGTSAYQYQAGVEIPIFEFQNSGTCTGLALLMENGDPFTPPNSQNGNVGNQITILGAGPGNAWTGNYAQGQADCSGGSGTPTCQIDAVTATQITDCGAADGTITISATSSGTLEYSVDGGSTWQSSGQYNNLAPGLYVVQIQTTGGACGAVYAQNPVAISEPTPPVIQSVSTQNPTDCGVADGSLTVTATSGSGTYEYQLDNNGWVSNNTFTNLAGGTYNVQVRNADGTCVVSQSATLTAPSAPAIQSVSTQDPTGCGVSDGSITIMATGGSGALAYSLDGVNWTSGNTFQNLGDNTYNVFVRNDDGSCASSGTAVTLTGPAGLTVSVTANDPSACGLSDGQVNVSASGGTGSYEYSVDNGANWSATGNFANLSAGNFMVLAKNANGTCESAPASNPVVLSDPNCPTTCDVEYVLELLPNGMYQVSLVPNVTWNAPLNITSTAQVTILAPAGGFVVSNLTNMIPGVVFEYNASYLAPVENPAFDYFVFGLSSQGTSGITYQQGVKVPLFTFSNAGTCTGTDLFLMDNDTDPFLPPNSQNGNVGQQITTVGSGVDAPICVSDAGVPCASPVVNDNCEVAYQLELLDDGYYQVSMIPDTTWLPPFNTTSTAQVTLVTPAGSLVIDSFQNLVPGAAFENNATYAAPTENPDKDYFLFGLITNGTTALNYEKGVKVPLFKFKNAGECTGDSLYLMPIEGDPFAFPNSQNANTGQQLTTVGSGPDANVCVIGSGVLCVPCGADLPDSDGDGICDNEELFNGSDPFNPCDPDIFNPACDYVCPDFFPADTLLWDGSAGPAEICVDVPFSEIGFYEILDNGAGATMPQNYCSLDTLTFYSYAFTVGQGNSGPYEVVSWEVNGQIFSGLVPDMAALADSMNVWDPAGNWQHAPVFAAISGGWMGQNYGDMTIRHVSSQVNTFIQPNITFVGSDAKLEVEGTGIHQLVINAPNGCTDTMIVHIFNPEKDTLELVYPVDSSMFNVCLDVSELPAGSYTTTFCGDPAHGTASITGENCIQYVTEPEYNGMDTICVVVCNDSAPVLCDTTLLVFDVSQYICNDIFATDTVFLKGNNGEASICVPLPLSAVPTYDILLDGGNYTLPVAPCAFDTLTFYTYSFTAGQGHDGPYEILSWEVNGNTFSGMAQDMDELATLMNQWDPAGNWQNMGLFSAISGGAPGGQYGKMKLKHVASGVPTTIQANFTVVATHTEFTISGTGWHDLILENKITGCSDTLIINITEPTTETITEVLSPNDPALNLCLNTDELPGNPAFIAFCDMPDNGTATTTAFNCVQYVPTPGFAGEDAFCVIICDDSPTEGPFCDTTMIQVVVPPAPDTLDFVLDPIVPTPVCMGSALEFSGTLVSAAICGENVDAVDATIGVGDCLELDPADTFVGDAEVCVVHCFESPLSGTVVCDTTILDLFVLPKNDTIEVDLTTFDPIDVCLTDLIGLPGNVTTGTICGENPNEVDAEMTSLDCLTLTQVTGFLNGTSEVCVVHCNDGQPQVCDTTTILVQVNIDCPEIFLEDTLYMTRPEVCVPVALTEIDAYDIVVNGAPYTFPPEPCDEDVLAFYSYSFTFGAGSAGPYEVVSWNVNGQVYSGMVTDMNDLVNKMNGWDTGANWLNDGNSLSVSNANATANAATIYGNMVIKHVASGVATTLFPNFTSIAQGSLVDLGAPGTHEVVVIDKATLCPDTVYVVVVDVTTEEVSVTTPFETPATPVCVPTDHLPGTVSVFMCESPQNGTLAVLPDGCFEYQPAAGFAGLDTWCLVACSDVTTADGEPICDTTRVSVIVLPKKDGLSLDMPMEETQTVCLDQYLDINAPITDSGVCGADANAVEVTTDLSACIQITGAPGFTGATEVCVFHCYDLAGTVVCDTTILDLFVLPRKDTVVVDLTGFDPAEICLGAQGVLDFAGNIADVTICQENPAEVDVSVNAGDCIGLDPADLFLGTSEVCVIHCNDDQPAVCDTTILLVNVSYPCEDIWVEDTIVQNNHKICVPIEFANLSIYDIILDGNDYVLPPQPCDEDSLVYYTYSFTVGAGNAGPYSVTWIVDDIPHSTTVQSMDALTAWMNLVDASGNWSNDPATSSINNAISGMGYGLMTVTHLGTGVPAILQANFTTVAFGTCVDLGEPGLHELVVSNTQTGCTDTLWVWYVDNATQTLSVTTPNGTPTGEICLDGAGLPGNVTTVSMCNTPQNGTIVWDGACFEYTPTGFYSGLEEICVVVCDDSPAPFGPFCDTTLIQITVEAPDCPALFAQDTFYLNLNDGADLAGFCTPILPQDFNIYDILVNGAPYTLPLEECDVETLVFYTYSFTAGAGNAGPYEVSSWDIDGVTYSTIVADMDELTAWMNQIDPAGNWQNDPTSFSISGGAAGVNYGNMVVTHIGLQIPAVLLPNFTSVAAGSMVFLPAGVNEVIFTNTENGCVDTVIVVVEQPTQEVLVASRVFLQGPYTGGGMNDNLRNAGYLPLEEPYSAYNPIAGIFKFVHFGGGGGEVTTPAVLAETGPDAIVDWVFLELRDANDNKHIIATRSALIQRDGDIVDVDGFSPVSFPVPADDYYLVVRHRNHLGIMTAEPLALSALVTSVDFTDPTTPTWGNNAQKDMGDGFMAMWGGDVNADGHIAFQGGNNDPDAIFFQVLLAPGNAGFDQNFIVDGYSHGDANMDGQVIYQGSNNDVDFMIFFNVLGHPDNPGFIINKVISEKLP